ncbi:TIM barrel protein [Saccharopolyspora sp. NPDC050389]|uniref:sugar phosphate isomerase/epimerase family protein n=1 Tax=Saccharopolyspora sp. NPDC050389 TaxID=3155516 RepID=UPI0033D8AA5F
MIAARRRVEICARDLPGAPADPAEAVGKARELGFGGVHFPSVTAISARHEARQLAEFAEFAAEQQVNVSLAVGMLNAYRLERAAELLAAGSGDLLRGFDRTLASAAALGVHELTVIVGTEADRFDPAIPWPEQLRATGDLLARLAPVLRDAGSRLLIKTHEEITTFEIVRLVEAVGPDVLGVAFDPVNVLIRLEDPVAAARRVAPHTRAIHLDDAWLCQTPRGLARRMCPLGRGILDWPPQLPEDTRLVLDFHRAELELPYFDQTWLAAQPDATCAELAALAAHAAADREPVSDLGVRLTAALDALPR